MVDVHWVALSLVPHLGGQTLRHLLAHYEGDIEAILRASPDDLMQIQGIGKKIAHAITQVNVSVIQTAMQQWRKAGVTLYTWDDDAYPATLKQLNDAPSLLFSLGQASPAQITAPQQKAIAIVGTRQPSPEAHQFALDCASVLAQHNTTIVSGLALGIDTYAHQGALTGGHTLAVMGSGVLNVYPPSNKAIADVIRIRGALLSENAPNAHATAPRLVARNRLISGLADALIVVQTAPDGGAMHAARFARQQNKPVFALDAPFAGNQQLIEQGATPLNPQLLGEPLQLLNIFGV